MSTFLHQAVLFHVATLLINTHSFTVKGPPMCHGICSSPWQHQQFPKVTLSTSRLHILNSADDGYYEDKDPRRAEFDIFEDDPMTTELSAIRKERIKKEKDVQSTFVPYGNDLWNLRAKLISLSKKLMERLSAGEDTKNTRKKLRELEVQDASTVYGLELDNINVAIDEGRFDDAEKHSARAADARSHLAQFNLEGLWVGKYGDHGFEMVNVTYIGDTLICRKVIGDKNVPVGEITFQVDLSPPRPPKSLSKTSQELPNIVLADEAAKRWGNKELQRFSGLGQVAEEGFKNSQWLEGQIILISEEYFSFAWLPLGHQIFFGRPSPELSLSMMQESMKKTLENNEIEASMDHISRCFEVTMDAIEDGSLKDPSDSCIFINDDSNSCCFE